MLKCISITLAFYIYFQLYLHYRQPKPDLCLDLHICQKQQKEQPWYAINKLILTEPEETIVISKYWELEKNIKVSDGCQIGVGYTTCMDVGFQATDLFKVMQQDFDKLQKIQPIIPKVHDKITELREFTETFLYYFSSGANAERVSDSKDVFQLLYNNVKDKLKHKDEIGGHSSLFAIRAQKELCNVFIAAQPTDFNMNNLPSKNMTEISFLHWPFNDILNSIDEQEKQRQKKHFDIHLVFEYNEGDQILGYKAPRSNRFYFVHDPNGAYFKQMEIYHNIASKYSMYQRHMFGGYQLMQKLNIKEAEERLQKQEQLWLKMKAQQKTDHRIHVEFAHFSRLDFFSLFEKYAVRHADSLGMNEQELILLLDYWQQNLQDINAARESRPTFDEILDQLKLFFQIIEQKNLNISRIHLHPYGSFFMCYDNQKWADARDAIIKSALTTPKYCIMSDNLIDQIENFDVPEIPISFMHPNQPAERIYTNKDNLTYNFDLTDNIYCYVQFFLKCRTIIKTAGMGDTISSTGFIYHPPINQIKQEIYPEAN